MATVIEYCPMCQDLKKLKDKRDYPEGSCWAPKICPVCEKNIGKQKKALKKSGKVKIQKIDPGVSGQDPKDQSWDPEDFLD